MRRLPYCGQAPLPAELFHRFNWDGVLFATLVFVVCLQLAFIRNANSSRRAAVIGGWLVAAVAFMSPLCALSVALFSARVGQHMVLVLIAAPLIALGLPAKSHRSGWPLWAAVGAFSAALWLWHMPVPYEVTFNSVSAYWCMHITLFGSAIWLWHELLQHSRESALEVMLGGALTCIQMGLLGATIALASHPLFRWHLITTQAFGLSPLEDQQLGGVIMWVPGIALFLWIAVRSLRRLYSSFEEARTT